ncbi:MAG: hypothetical protein M1419_04760 [Bacteroidetes bacterium]|nr:hypothetical protein [Bacteroidota bacterium]
MKLYADKEEKELSIINNILDKHNVSSMEIVNWEPVQNPVENLMENVKSIEQEIADILPGPEPKIKPETIRHFESDFGKIEWNTVKKIIIFDNGVVFTEKEILNLHQSNNGEMITPEQWNLKTSFKGKFVEPELRMLDAKAS